ncbi:hypothetical protein [Archangium sp. Cb G35]|uniref:hypothetical protein n=1 Tax=Archangium sp. Cb G35 TaxID=1920190 RepID=UPI000A90CB87|nr:hypothetical protein [Archangium sp. Cb G35]
MTIRTTSSAPQTASTSSKSTTDAAQQAAQRAAEAARQAAAEALRAAREAAAAARQARSELQAQSFSQAKQPAGQNNVQGSKLEQKVLVAETQARELGKAAQKAIQHANDTARDAGRPLPFAGPARNTATGIADTYSADTQGKASPFGPLDGSTTLARFANEPLGVQDAGGPQQTAATDSTRSTTAAEATRAASSPEEAHQNLVNAQEAYDEAQKRTEELNAQLNSELAKLGPGLTEEQKQQYVAEFRERYPDEYAAEAAAARELNTALNDPKLMEAARGNPDIAEECVEAATDLAGSPEAKGALEWAAKAQDPNGPAGTAFAGLEEKINDDVIPTAISTVAGQLLTEHDGDVEAALAALTEITEPLVPLGKGGAAIKTGIETIKNAIASGNPAPLRQLAESSKIGAALAGAGVVFGLASAVTDAQRGEWGDVVKDLAGAGRSGAQLAAYVMRTLGESGRVAAATGEKAAAFLGRLAPAFGVVANAVILADHFMDFVDDPTVGGGIRAFGDAIAVVGAGLGTVLPGVGHIVEGVGLVLSAVGELLVGKEEQERLDNESEAILLEMGMDPDVAKTLAHGDNQPQQLADDLGLSPEQIQELAKNHPDIFDAPGLGGAVIDAAKACGMEGEDAVEFIDKLAEDNPNFAWDLLGVKPLLQGDGTNPTATEDGWRAFVQSNFPSAYAHATENAPDVFGEDAESRLQADRDYELNAGSTDLWNTYARLCEQHKDDPAYTSRFIERMKEEGTLDIFVESIAHFGLDMDYEGARAAIDAALETGVLTEEELQNHLDGEYGDAWRAVMES